MEITYISLISSSEKIPFRLTYGIHKELQEYLLIDDRLFNLFTDAEIGETVVKICLSKRNEMGQIINEFVSVQDVMGEDITVLLELIFDYFSEFFLTQQERVMKVSQRLNQISQQSTPS